MLAVVIVDACHAEFVLGWDADVRSPDHILIESQVAHLLRHSVRGELYAVVGEEIGDFLFVGLSFVEYDEVLIAIVFNLKDRLDVYKLEKISYHQAAQKPLGPASGQSQLAPDSS